MADDAFNGSVAKWPTAGDTLGPLRSINYRNTAARADLTGSSDAQKKFKTGVPSPEVVVGIVGAPPAAAVIGGEGDLSIVWSDGSTLGTLSKVVVADVAGPTGQMDGEITSQLTFIPGPNS